MNTTTTPQPTTPITTTLAAIRAHSPCKSGWERLLAHLGKTQADDEPLTLLTVLDSNGLDDALWCLRARPDLDGLWRLCAVEFARRVQHLMSDQRSIAALDVAERFARGQATREELSAAEAAAWAAVRTAAGGDAAWAAWAAAAAGAWDAAWDAAVDATKAAAARAHERSAQDAILRRYLAGEVVL
jgi:2-polyprenyl-6-methoxyphenol hydroxylase-like FAD-dependent oxidoreductase